MATLKHARYVIGENPVTGFAFALFVLIVIAALLGPYIVPYDPLASDTVAALKGPSRAHWFGTDQLGRDVFSRVIVGAQDILTVAPLATILGTILGAALGLVTGYFRGYVDDAISRMIDAVNALPLVIIALLALVALGSSDATVVVVIGVIFAPLVLALVFVSPQQAAVTASGVIIAATSATAIQLWFRVQARRSQFRRRQTSSRIATFAEAFSSIGWAATAALALTIPAIAPFPGLMTAGILAATWKISPRRD